MSDGPEVDTDRRTETFSTGTEEGEADSPLFDAGAADEKAGYASCEEALEDAIGSLERVTGERDDYLEMAQRVQAEFANYRKRVEAQRTDQIARAADHLAAGFTPEANASDGDATSVSQAPAAPAR